MARVQCSPPYSSLMNSGLARVPHDIVVHNNRVQWTLVWLRFSVHCTQVLWTRVVYCHTKVKSLTSLHLPLSSVAKMDLCSSAAIKIKSCWNEWFGVGLLLFFFFFFFGYYRDAWISISILDFCRGNLLSSMWRRVLIWVTSKGCLFEVCNPKVGFSGRLLHRYFCTA